MWFCMDVPLLVQILKYPVIGTFTLHNFFIKYMLYKNALDRTIFICLNVIIFLKIGCANLDAAPISPLLPYFEI